MPVDARSIPTQSRLDCDVCIVGAGPIGTTIASEFIGSGQTVILLESGGLRVGSERNELSKLASGAQHGPNDHITAIRRFGGNSSAWIQILTKGKLGVRFGEFQDADFEKRDGIEHSGWPISRQELLPYTRRVAERWELDPEGFKASTYGDIGHLPFDGIENFQTSVYQFPDATLPRERFKNELLEAANCTIIYNATATQVFDESSDGLASVKVQSDQSAHFRVFAKRIILAGGAMSTTQLLLHSPTAAGHTLGNASGAVGHYLMDHPLLRAGDLLLSDPNLIEKFKLYDNCNRGRFHSQGYFHPTDDFLESNADIANLNMFFLPRRSGYAEEASRSERELRIHRASVHAKLALQRRHVPEIKDIFTALSGPDIVARSLLKRFLAPRYSLGRGGWSNERDLQKRYDRFQIIQYAEQLPHPDNRLYLSEETDELGMHRIQFDFQLHESDRFRFKNSQRLMKQSLERSGLGRVDMPFDDDSADLDIVALVIGHYMGTTRMGDDPHTSVVDRDCRIHGSDAIFIASTSTFPTGGTSNPTLTGLSLGLRVADQVRSELH